jgi:hypothetical protein
MLLRPIQKLLLPSPLMRATSFRFMPCPTCCNQCVACKDGRYPDELTLTFAGIRGDWWCQDCPRANASWALRREGDCLLALGPGAPQSAAVYHAAFPDVPMCACGGAPATLDVALHIYWNYAGLAGKRLIAATVGNNLGCLAVRFQLEQSGQSEPFDCMSFNNLLVPYNGSGALCSSPGATCLVSA